VKTTILYPKDEILCRCPRVANLGDFHLQKSRNFFVLKYKVHFIRRGNKLEKYWNYHGANEMCNYKSNIIVENKR